jgi:uncharacterized membrane protein
MNSEDRTGRWADFHKDGGQILNIREEVERRRSPLGSAMEWTARVLARPGFLILLFAVHLLWIVANIPGLILTRPPDPYPFPLLAMFASVEAPFLALLILMGQHREQRINELRDEVDVQVALYVEREVSAALRMIESIAQKVGADPHIEHQALQELRRPLDPQRLLEHVHRHLDKSTGEKLP